MTGLETRNTPPVLAPPAPLLRHGVASVLCEAAIALLKVASACMEDRLLRSRNPSHHENEFVMGSLFTIVGRILPANARQMAACRIACGFEAEIL